VKRKSKSIRRKYWLGTMLLGLGLVPHASQAYLFDRGGRILNDLTPEAPEINWEEPSPAGAREYRGIGRIFFSHGKGPGNLCTATLIRQASGGPVYLLTAGHCLYGPDGKVFAAGAIHLSGKVDATFYGVDEGREDMNAPLKISRILYADHFAHSDIALLETNVSPDYLKEHEIRPRRIAPLPAPLREVEILGFPKMNPTTLKRSVGNWVATADSLDLSKTVNTEKALLITCSVLPGYSGGPMLYKEEILGVVSNIRSPTAYRESLGLDPNNARIEGYNHAVPVGDLASCFDAKGVFDFRIPGCRLDVPCTGTGCDQQACDRGSPHACLRIGAYERSCKLGLGKGCLNHAFTFKTALDARPWYQLGCQNGSGEACFESARALPQGSQREEAMRYACLHYSGAACDELARGKIGTPQGDLQEAAAFLAQGCLDRFGPSCRTLAYFYEAGKGVYRSYKTSLKLYEQGCGLRDAPSCRMAALAHDHYVQQGVTQFGSTLESAQRFHKYACYLGVKASCK